MKLLNRYLSVAIVSGILAFSQAVWAGEGCCKKTGEAVKKGEACEKCVEHQCCQDAAKKAAHAGDVKCSKCSASKEGGEKKDAAKDKEHKE